MKLELVTIAVKDLEESVDFYKEILGLTEFRRINPFDGVNIVFMKDEESSVIELIQHTMDNEPVKSGNLSKVSITFSVKDLAQVRKLLDYRNIKIMEGPFENYIFIHDPNSVRLGLKEIKA